jgi:hypothetical protein
VKPQQIIDDISSILETVKGKAYANKMQAEAEIMEQIK